MKRAIPVDAQNAPTFLTIPNGDLGQEQAVDAHVEVRELQHPRQASHLAVHRASVAWACQ